jgi:hypothetical protein
MSGFARAAAAVAAAFIVSSSALGAIDVEGNRATFAWTPSSGPVAYYTVHLARDGRDLTQAVEAYVSEPRATVHGQFGETIRVGVVAWARNGDSLGSSLPSPLSEEVRFVKPSSAAATGAVAQARGSAPPATDTGGDSATSAPKPPPPPSPERGAAPYDFDGDGRTDLLWWNKRTRDVAVWLMNGTSPSKIADLGTLSGGWSVVGSEDFDRDGLADLLLQSSESGQYEIWFMNGGWVRDSVRMRGPGGGYTAEAIGDFDGDGYADLLWENGEKGLLWFMRGSTVDEAVAGPKVEKLSAACAPDLNGDARSDVVWSGPDETVAWLMLGSLPWRTGRAGPRMKESSAVGCGDADGDGFGDLSFELPQLEARWAMEVSGDFDGDGLANEILLRHEATGMIEVWKLQWDRQRTSFSVVSRGGSGMGDRRWEVVAP